MRVRILGEDTAELIAGWLWWKRVARVVYARDPDYQTLTVKCWQFASGQQLPDNYRCLLRDALNRQAERIEREKFAANFRRPGEFPQARLLERIVQ